MVEKDNFFIFWENSLDKELNNVMILEVVGDSFIILYVVLLWLVVLMMVGVMFF